MNKSYRGFKASEKPRAPTGEFVAEEKVTECKDGIKRTVCDCGRVVRVVADTEHLTRVKCECTGAKTGCRTV